MDEFDIEKYHHYNNPDKQDEVDINNKNKNETENIENNNPTETADSSDAPLFKKEDLHSPSPTEYEDIYSGIEERDDLFEEKFQIDGNKESDNFVVSEVNNSDFHIENDVNDDEKKKRKRNKKALVITAIAIVTVVALLVGAFFILKNDLIGRIKIDNNSGDNVFVNQDDMVSIPDVYNVLLIGADDLEETDGEFSRSDTMILLSLDSINKKIKLTSFMRDLYVAIPGMANKNRINEAYNTGGQQLAMDTIEYLFGINIDAYVMVTFTTFVDAIEKLGGINVDITESEAKYIQKIAPHIKSGSNIELNGDEALLYARMRKLDNGDFTRTERQRKVIEALIEKAKSTNPITVLNMTFQVADDITTSISSKEISKLASSATTYASYEIEQFRIPADGTFEEKTVKISNYSAQILDPDIAKNKAKLFEFIYPQEAANTTTSDDLTSTSED